MATKIRLQRKGAKKRPFYRIVVVDSRQKRDGAVIEVLGTYNPMVDPPAIKLDRSKTEEWIGKGAEPTHSVKNIIQRVTNQPEEKADTDQASA